MKSVMAISDLLKDFNNSLFEYSGTAHKVADHLLKGEKERTKSLFFKPYQSKADFGLRAASIIVAPASFALLALELLADTFYFAGKALYKLASLDASRAKTHAIDSLMYLVSSIATAVVALVSPIVNLVDLAGSAVSTLLHKEDDSREFKFAH